MKEISKPVSVVTEPEGTQNQIERSKLEQDACRVKWRIGNRCRIHVYAGDVPICTALNPEYAQLIVNCHNAILSLRESEDAQDY